MESALSPDKEKSLPPVPLKTYQWEDLRRSREAGGYPWTHLNKPPLKGEITAEDIIRATTPIRSMSREFSRSRTQSPDNRDSQRILNLNSSPGSSRKHNEEGQEEGIHVPNFSKEISLDSEDDIMKKTAEKPETQISAHLMSPPETDKKPKNISPKGILKRRVPEQQYIGVTETREKTKCCHPLVNKIKHLADKTLQKLDRNDNEKSPTSKRKKGNEEKKEIQEIRQLKNSPSAVKRQKFSAIKLGSSDEMSKTMSIDTPPLRMRKDHIYEDIEEPKDIESPILPENVYKDDNKSNSNKENDSLLEKKSTTSQDPSLIADDNTSLKHDEHIMEKLHIMKDNTNKEAIILDEEMDQETPNVDEIFKNQVDDARPPNDSPNITITEIPDDDDHTNHMEQSTTVPIETSPSPSPREHERKRHDVQFFDRDWSKPSSDHEYEIIEKPPPNIIYTAPSIDEHTPISKADDELSSTTSLERKCLQHTDDEDQTDNKENSDEKNKYQLLSELSEAEALQKDIEDRYFVNTPSTMSRTECEISTSQVDSSALENLPLKRDSRNKNGESLDSKIQQRFKESTGKLKTQAGKLRTKLHNLKTKQFSLPERTKISSPERSKIKLPERSKFSFPERPKFTLPDRRKFSLPDRPKFKKINISEKLSFGDRKKFTMPERPKFSIPDLPKFKMPERSKQIFSSLGRKKTKTDMAISDSSSDLHNVASVEFEAKTYPRLFHKKKKSQMTKTSSSPTLNREDTPPPTFTFTRMKKTTEETPKYIPDSPEHPREYGAIDSETSFENEIGERRQFDTTYDFDKIDPDYLEERNNQSDIKNTRNSSSIPDVSPSKQEYTHINEINNDEFFVRPRGISHENIQVREYLSDEIRQAFNIPKNVLATMGSTGIDNEKMYMNETEPDPELEGDDNDHMQYSTEDLNERDDGYYTFPPVRPSRAKRKKKEMESLQYMDDSVNASMQFSEVDLGISEDNLKEIQNTNFSTDDNKSVHEIDLKPSTDLHSIHEYANDDIIEYPDNIPIQSQTLPMPPKRKKRLSKDDVRHSYSNDFNNFSPTNMWQGQQQSEDIIVYRTEHEYIIPQSEAAMTGRSPVPPRRTRSRSSRGTSVCDDDRTSHGAESLTLDTHLPQDFDDKSIRQESPGYATVDKGPNVYNKQSTRAKSKTPPARRRKSNSSERKYYTVSGTKNAVPNRPPRKKSSSSLLTLDSFTKHSMNGDTQYDEIEEPKFEKDLKSGTVLSKMKDRPLPPPPRPPRGPRRKKDFVGSAEDYTENGQKEQDVVEIEVSTQTDPLPDDVDFELGIDDNLDISMSSSLRDIIDEESIIGKNISKPTSSHISRPSSRSEKSLKLSDPKIADLSKSNIGRTSPTVILVEKRVSSPTRINDRDEILTEASLTVQHIDMESSDSKVPEVPPLPKARSSMKPSQSSKNIVYREPDNALERISDSSRDIQLDNLITQRLQVRDLDVGRLNVSELQASKILVSEIEGMTLNVNELDSKSGHIAVNGLEFSQSVIDEIVKKFAEISTSRAHSTLIPQSIDVPRPVSREEETQTEPPSEDTKTDDKQKVLPPSPSSLLVDNSVPPQRPPPPDLTPLLLSYLQDMAPTQMQTIRPSREPPTTEFFETQFQSPHPPTRRSKRKFPVPHTESSTDDEKPRPSPRRLPPARPHEPTISEAGAQFLRVCQNSISRTLRNIFNVFMSYINRAEDKKDVQMAMVIFLVLIAGLIMLGLSDSRTIHHHHWEFFNPPDTNK